MNTRLRLSVLGPIEVFDGTETLAVEGPTRRRVLAVLAAARGAVVPVDRLVEALWGDDPPETAKASLQSHVSHLRRSLGSPSAIVGSPDGYSLAVDDVDLDATRFEREATSPHPGGETDAARTERLREALSLWRGRAFGEFADVLGVRGEALRLEELRLVATEELVDARLAQGRHVEVIGELEALVIEHPLRECFWRQLMLALHRSGRQAEALRRATTLRTMLRDELGLEPSPAARELEQHILTDEPGSVAPAPPADPTASIEMAEKTETAGTPRNPRREATPLVGREDDLARLVAALDRTAIVTLCGTGGVGKSRLAMRAAGELGTHVDDVAFVELAPLRDPQDTVQVVARALDVEQRQGLSLVDTVEDYLSGRRVLLVLDNIEHVVDVVAPLVERWTQVCSHLGVLATGREPLGLPGEHVQQLEPLALPEVGARTLADVAGIASVQLFVDRVLDVRPHDPPTDTDVDAIVEICRRLDGLPLAIELAAARTRSLGIEGLARRLDQRFALLTGQRHTLDPRHRALHHLVEWSYDLLDPDERRTFEQLSTFAGSFGLDAAEAVCQPDHDHDTDRRGLDDPTPRIMSLVDKSMVQLVDPDEPRYRLLETLRQFGRDRLSDATAVRRLDDRHRAWYVDLATRAAVGLDSADEGRWSTRIDRDLDDLRAAHGSAIAIGDLDAAVGLVAALHEFAFRRIRYEVTSWADTTAGLPGFADHPAAAVVLAVSAYGRWVRGDLADAGELAHRSLRLDSDAISTGLAVRVLANVEYYRDRADDAHAWTSRMLDIARTSGSDARVAHASYMYSVAHTAVGESDRGLELADDAAAAARRCGAPTAAAQAAYARGLALRSSSGADAAERELWRAAELGETAGNRWIRAFALTEVHSSTARRGELMAALRGLAEVIDTWYRGGDWANQWLSMRHVLGIFVELGADRSAAVLHGALVAMGAASALPIQPADAEHLSAEVDRLRERLPTAEHRAAVRAGAAMGDGEIVAHVRATIDQLTGPRP